MKHLSRRTIILAVVGVLLALLLLKTTTVSLAALGAYNAAQGLQANLQNGTPVQIEASAVRTARAATRLNNETRPLRPAIRLFGARGCTAAELLGAADAVLPVANALAPLTDEILLSAQTATADSIDVTAFRAAWANAAINANALAADLRTARERTAACDGATGQLLDAAEAADGGLFGLYLLVSVPWDEVLADSTRWVVILNNSDELRATGGFTTAALDVSVKEGVLRWDVLNSYAIDNPETAPYHPDAPLPMFRYMEPMKWWFRDANWSPHHPRAADVALRLYTLDRGVQRPAGLVSVNLTAIQTLAGDLPPIQVSGQSFTAQNALTRIRDGWGGEAGLPSEAPQRKQYLFTFAAELGQALLFQLDPVQQAKLGNTLETMIVQRDVIVYSEQPALAAFIAELNADGRLIEPAAPSDYLMVVDTNLGYNKVTPFVERHYHYTVTLGDEPTANLTLTYTHTLTQDFACTQFNHILNDPKTYYDRMNACFWNYVRVLVPPGAQIANYDVYGYPAEWFTHTRKPSPAKIDAIDEPPYHGFGSMLVVPTGDTRDIAFNYTLPTDVVTQESDTHRYRLYVQKQPGAVRQPEISVHVCLPDGATFVSAIPTTTAFDDGCASTGGTLLTDATVEVVYRLP